MAHRTFDTPPARSGLPVFLIALVAVLLIGVIWTLVGGDAPSDDVAATDTVDTSPEATEPSSDGTTDGTTPATPATSTSSTAPAADLPALQGVSFELLAEGLNQPTAIAAPPGDDRVFFTERIGRVRILDDTGAVLPDSFLNITDRVVANGIEQGLLGLAFHPDYATNGRFFVYYTNKAAQRTLSEFTVSASVPNSADLQSERVLFSFPQPEGSTDIRHYGGALDFGPDGYLWVTLGDGADSRDQGQDPNTLFAALLRLDVDTGDPYGIPADNPFVNGGGAPEVWAYGIRNPWRMSVDDETRLVYLGDVGQGDREEINVLRIDQDAGANLGWANVEGTRCFFEDNCDPASYFLPTVEYDHGDPAEGGGCSVTGGVVYRGSEIPELDGQYFYGDWCSQWIKSFVYDDGVPSDERDWTVEYAQAGQPNGFGLDADGELYVATFGGSILKLTAQR